MTSEEVKNTIARVGKEIGADVPLLFGIAYLESRFTAHQDRVKYAGVYQISEGWGGCSGDDRLDVSASVRCVWNQHKGYKDRFIKNTGGEWDPFYSYGMHQQGVSGFFYLYRNRNKLLSEIDEVRRKNIYSNKPGSLVWHRVSDWFDYFRARFYEGYSMAKDYVDLDLPDKQDTGNKLLVGKKVFDSLVLKCGLFVGVSCLLIWGFNRWR